MNERITNFLLPPYLTIELSNTCNYKCPMCTLSEKDPIHSSFIKIDVFNKLIEEIYSSDMVFSDIRLFWAGEPLLHPNFDKLLKILAEHEKKNPKFKLVSMDTNASMLYGKKLNSICDYAEVLKLAIIISLDAFSEKTYKLMRAGGDFDSVRKNIISLLEHVKNREYPKVAVQFVISKNNAHELKDFISFWKNEYTLRGIDFNILLNSSAAEANGVNLRPLTEQNNPNLQDDANKLYLETLLENGIISSIDEISIDSQGGGRYEEK